ncbi:MAG TPA: hypothetical protein VL550_04130 [Rhodocyclaceae bacterium]|jgi:hypothetical protein|nr:hypothetical protein [Rhodocyclaceae bacterium]
MKLSRYLGLLCLLCVSLLAHANSDVIVKLDRSGKAPLYYIATAPDTPTKVGAILFAGGDGSLHLAEKQVPGGDNFLVRSRGLFADQGIATASFDPSSDSGPLVDGIRKSDLHVQEISEVLADFKRRFNLDHVFLIGTSRGTVSAAYASLPLRDQISGVVLTSSIFESSRQGTGLAGFDFTRISVPLLFVHNCKDSCKFTPPYDAERLQDRFTVVFMDADAVGGGDSCGPFSAHGYLGKEKETIGVISDWVFAHVPSGPAH